MIQGKASRLMLKIESFITTLAAIDCAIRWSNLFSMRLATPVFAGLLLLQSVATFLLLTGVAMTLWELWNRRTASRRRRAFWKDDLESAGDPYYVLCEIPYHRHRANSGVAVQHKPCNATAAQALPRKVSACKLEECDGDDVTVIQVRAKREIWFTAASAFIDDFLVPCVFWMLYQSSCEAFNASGGNNWFDIAESAIGSMAALFVWIAVGSLLMRMANLTRRRQFAPHAHWFTRCVLYGLFWSGSILAVAFSMCQTFMLGLFLSTQCPTVMNSSTAIDHDKGHHHHVHFHSVVTAKPATFRPLPSLS